MNGVEFNDENNNQYLQVKFQPMPKPSFFVSLFISTGLAKTPEGANKIFIFIVCACVALSLSILFWINRPKPDNPNFIPPNERGI